LYLPDKYGSINFADRKLVWKNYNYDIKFIHPVKFHGDEAKTNREKLENKIIPYSKGFTNKEIFGHLHGSIYIYIYIIYIYILYIYIYIGPLAGIEPVAYQLMYSDKQRSMFVLKLKHSFILYFVLHRIKTKYESAKMI
jgi:hypothetical protein